MPGFFDRFRRRTSAADNEARARALFERAVACDGESEQLPSSLKTSRLHEAIQCYRQVLTIISVTDFPEQWAQTQFLLGLTYLKLPSSNHVEYLGEALACFQSALEGYNESKPAEGDQSLSCRFTSLYRAGISRGVGFHLGQFGGRLSELTIGKPGG